MSAQAPWRRRWAHGLVWAWLVRAAGASFAGEGGPLVDGWWEGALPGEDAPGLTAGFEGLSASVPDGGGRLSIVWSSSAPEGAAFQGTGDGWVVEWSAGAPGHWASRDWRVQPLAVVDGCRRAFVPLLSAVEPVVYRLRKEGDGGGRGGAQVTAPRVYRPALADPPVTVGPFSGLLDGFEEGIGGWSGAVPGIREGFSWTSQSLTGRGALRIQVPERRASMTVGTVRLQGWMLSEFSPRAVRFAARTESGEGRVSCRLHGHAGTEQLSVFPAKGEFRIGPEWRRLEIPIEAFAGLRATEVDWLSLQFRAEAGRVLLVDDLELVLR